MTKKKLAIIGNGMGTCRLLDELTAREATAQERERLWPALLDLYPAYGDYQGRTEREIPVVVLSAR